MLVTQFILIFHYKIDKNAIDYKNQGNEFFKKNELDKALSKYARAFLFLQAIDKANSMPEETKNLTSKEE